VADDKQSLRKIFVESREALNRSFADRLGGRIQRRLIDSDAYRRARGVLLYAAHRGEVSTDAILSDALAAEKATYYPRLTSDRARIEVVAAGDRDAFIAGAYGILEPRGEAIAKIQDVDRLLICVPGLAFSLDGHRLGRGGGHYDRLLAGLAPPAVAIGLAYSFQLLDELPTKSHDRRLDFIVTESALHRIGADAPAPAGIAADKGGTPRWC
jgi:5-formyltetrahydrofolate cyclo-ligase